MLMRLIGSVFLTVPHSAKKNSVIFVLKIRRGCTVPMLEEL